MQALLQAADWSVVDYKDRGADIKRRRLLLGVDSHRAFAEATGVTRAAIKHAEEGDPSTHARTYDRLEAWLDQMELESGSEREDAHAAASGGNGNGDELPVTIHMVGVFGVDEVTFSGPASQAEVVRHLAADWLRDMRDRDAKTETGE